MKKAESFRMLAVFLAIAILIPLCGLANAKAVGVASIDFTIEEGRLLSSEATGIQSAIDGYFSAREVASVAVGAISGSKARANSKNAVLSDDTSLRANSLMNFWAEQGIDLVSTESTSSILDVKATSYSNELQIAVYEWTSVYYNNGEGPDSEATDFMGFATVHDMTLAMQADGSFAVSRDSYDEADISGHTSSDYDAIAFDKAMRGIDTRAARDAAFLGAEAVSFGLEGTVFASAAVAATNDGGMPNVFACIDYANKHVVKNIETNAGTSVTSYYNTAVYGYAAANDCANYVSQCLLAGGFQMDGGLWYHNQGGSTACSQSWNGTQSFANYWGPKYGGVVAVTSNMSNVFPGNPLYLSDLSHITICVGYNSAGNPILNGHTRDVYHQVMTSNATYAKTIEINKTTSMIAKPSSAASVPSTLPYTYSGLYLQKGKAEWFKFTPSTSGYYSVFTGGSVDTVGYLYQQSKAGDYGTMYMYEIATNDTSSWGGESPNFRMGANLTAGSTYYVMVRGKTPETLGTYSLTFQKG